MFTSLSKVFIFRVHLIETSCVAPWLWQHLNISMYVLTYPYSCLKVKQVTHSNESPCCCCCTYIWGTDCWGNPSHPISLENLGNVTSIPNLCSISERQRTPLHADLTLSELGGEWVGHSNNNSLLEKFQRTRKNWVWFNSTSCFLQIHWTSSVSLSYWHKLANQATPQQRFQPKSESQHKKKLTYLLLFFLFQAYK